MSEPEPKPYNMETDMSDTKTFKKMEEIVKNAEKENEDILIIYKKGTRIRSIGHAGLVFLLSSVIHLLDDVKTIKEKMGK